jgi:hypothetical protein
MNFTDAAVSALYPVMVILGMTIWSRYLPLISKLDNGVRTLVCSLLLVVTTIIGPQLYYGLGRFTGSYIQFAMNPVLVAILKLGYVSGFCYMLYAFWLLAPSKPRLVIPLLLSFGIWGAVTIALMF